MATIEADYTVLTPMFCAGADQSRPELRVPSFKGVLRFWWRALAWSRLGGDLKKIHEEEDHIFGGPGIGRSRVAIQIVLREPDPRHELKAGSVLNVGDGARYLGYGLMDTRSKLLRACYGAPFNFTVRLRLRGDVDLTGLSRALQAAGLFGGLGGRTRRGYGSIALREIKIDGKQTWKEPDSLDALGSAIRDCMQANVSEVSPQYTAFCRGSRIVVVTAQSVDPLAMLDLVGREMIRFRSWGRNGKILGNTESERTFVADHDLMKRPAAQRTTHPERIAFGLPHNCKEGPVGPKGDLDRRASPLFIHIHECVGKPVAVLAFLPSVFLPEGTDINVAGARVKLAPEAQLYKPVSDFVDRFAGRRYKEPFTGVFEVKL
jgi:CRISPR-associated protein Cmr1